MLFWIEEDALQDGALIVPAMLHSLDVYKNSERIYHFGEFGLEASDKYAILKLHHITLGKLTQDDKLFLRIYSEDINYLRSNFHRLFLGSQIDIFRTLIKY